MDVECPYCSATVEVTGLESHVRLFDGDGHGPHGTVPVDGVDNPWQLRLDVSAAARPAVVTDASTSSAPQAGTSGFGSPSAESTVRSVSPSVPSTCSPPTQAGNDRSAVARSLASR